ncbi:MAG: hypothetical protein ACE5OY_05440 [Candidatus Bathyarchaeia archaeon]
MSELARRLGNCTSFKEIFGIVKEAVKRELGLARGGLMLGLSDLPAAGERFVGGLYPVGSNIIVLNRIPLEMLSNTTDELFNSYCFYVLLHEYIHTLGVLNERQVSELTYRVCRNALGPSHPATRISLMGIASLFSGPHALPALRRPIRRDIEIIRDFDDFDASYFS